MPNTTCDLHLHTYYSDGRASPGELLHHAAGLGLKTVAITDHENINALAEAKFVAGELGLELIPAIEISTRWEECISPSPIDPGYDDIDILGYYVDEHNPDFLVFSRQAMADLRERIVDCCASLTTVGYPVNLQDVLDENPRYPGAMQLISALWHMGYAGSWNEAFPLFAMEWKRVRPCRFTVDQVIQAVHAAGGIAVLAHPVSVRCKSGWLQAAQMERLVAHGLDGLEVLHPRLDAEARAHFSALARQFNLIITGGSDEHGWRSGFSRLGSEPVGYHTVLALRARRR